MDATTETKLLVNWDRKQSIPVNLAKALLEFREKRWNAEPVQIRINPKTAFHLNGIRVVLDSRIREGQIEVTGLEGTL